MLPFLFGFPSGGTAAALGVVGMLAPWAGVCWAWARSNETPPWLIEDEPAAPRSLRTAQKVSTPLATFPRSASSAARAKSSTG
jgi:hypothetical protein